MERSCIERPTALEPTAGITNPSREIRRAISSHRCLWSRNRTLSASKMGKRATMCDCAGARSRPNGLRWRDLERYAERLCESHQHGKAGTRLSGLEACDRRLLSTDPGGKFRLGQSDVETGSNEGAAEFILRPERFHLGAKVRITGRSLRDVILQVHCPNLLRWSARRCNAVAIARSGAFSVFFSKAWRSNNRLPLTARYNTRCCTRPRMRNSHSSAPAIGLTCGMPSSVPASASRRSATATRAASEADNPSR